MAPESCQRWGAYRYSFINRKFLPFLEDWQKTFISGFLTRSGHHQFEEQSEECWVQIYDQGIDLGRIHGTDWIDPPSNQHS